jgi:hypothetical protein
MAFRIQVPDPCKEDWNAMSERKEGRYCTKCDTVVPDLSRTSDDALIHLVHRDALPHCARFTQGQLDRVMRAQPDPVARLQALVLAAAVVVAPAAAEAQPPSESETVQKKDHAKKPKKRRFKVKALDPSAEFLVLPTSFDSSFTTLGFSVIHTDGPMPMPDTREKLVLGGFSPVEEPTFYGFARVEEMRCTPTERYLDPLFCEERLTPDPAALTPGPEHGPARPAEPEKQQEQARPAMLAVFFRHQRSGGSLRRLLASVFGSRAGM